jgi:hypothetical protein
MKRNWSDAAQFIRDLWYAIVGAITLSVVVIAFGMLIAMLLAGDLRTPQVEKPIPYTPFPAKN